MQVKNTPGADGTFADPGDPRGLGGGPVPVVVWVGEVTWREVADLRESLFDAMDAHLVGVQLDVRLVTFIDRTGIALLIGANHRSHSMGRPLILLDDNGPVTAALTGAHVGGDFTVVRTSGVPAQRAFLGSAPEDDPTLAAAASSLPASATCSRSWIESATRSYSAMIPAPSTKCRRARAASSGPTRCSDI